MSKIDKIIEKGVPNRHSFFQLNFFVLGKEPTHQAKLRRCVQELKTRKSSLEAMQKEIEESCDKNEILQESFGIELSAARERTRDRQIEANKKAVTEIKVRMKEMEEEVMFFTEAFEKLSEIEAMKIWDDPDVQIEYWNAKLSEEINYRLLMKLPLDIEIIRTALALPGGVAKNKVKALLGSQQKKLEE